ncbi:MAG: methylmalonyl-CoA carboxyltransferase, partial [Candidatus Hydrogenedentes bacterium]|nr:methylmalonyl-CoA carboxyltransferase [Candidatus Hydrogenedentota bacterium]
MSWRDEVDELNRRAEMARQMGGPENVEFHRNLGKLNVRERIDALADPDTFQEIGVLAGHPEWDGNTLKNLVPAHTVTGSVRINGRK